MDRFKELTEKQPYQLCVNIKNWTNKGYLVVSVYYQPPHQGNSVDMTYFLQLQEGLYLQAVILVGDFYHQVPAGKTIERAADNPGSS